MTRLLLVDDDDSNRLTLSALLEDEASLAYAVALGSVFQAELDILHVWRSDLRGCVPRFWA